MRVQQDVVISDHSSHMGADQLSILKKSGPPSTLNSLLR
jgi:hypothetical protein